MTLLYDICILLILIVRFVLEILGLVLAAEILRDTWNDYRTRSINQRAQAIRLQQIKDGIHA